MRMSRRATMVRRARTYGIDDAPQAFADLEAGREGRGVIVFDAT